MEEKEIVLSSGKFIISSVTVRPAVKKVGEKWEDDHSKPKNVILKYLNFNTPETIKVPFDIFLKNTWLTEENISEIEGKVLHTAFWLIQAK